MTIYVYEGHPPGYFFKVLWLDVQTGQTITTGPFPSGLPEIPGPNDVAIFPQVDGGPDSIISDKTNIGVGVVAPGVTVRFGTPGEGGGVTFGSLYVDSGATVSVGGGSIADIGNAVLAPGSTLSLQIGPFGGSNFISQLWNSGGSVNLGSFGGINPVLALGGPGFLQVGGIEPQESNLHNARTDWINLGNVAQGANLAPILEDIWNGNSKEMIGSFRTWGDGGFTVNGFNQTLTLAPNAHDEGYSLDSPHPPGDILRAGTITPNTSQLGSHVEIVQFSGGYTLAVVDHVVPA